MTLNIYIDIFTGGESLFLGAAGGKQS